MKKVKEFLNYILAPRIYINKKYYGTRSFPEKELESIWKKQQEVFDLMDKLFERF